MKKIVLSLLILFLLHMSAAFAQLTIESCQQKARANYPAIKQYDLISKSQEYSISIVNKAYFPQLSVNGIAGYLIQSLPVQPGSESSADKFQLIGIAQLHQTIWDGGATHAQKEIIRANAGVDSANINVSLYTLNDRVNQLYFGMLLIDEQLKQLNILKENLNRNLDATKLSMQNGVAYQSDVDQVKVEIIKAEQRETELNSSRKAYADMLSQMIGEPVNEDAQLQIPVDTDVNASVINRPELNLYENQHRLIDAQMKNVTVGYMPKIGLLGTGALITPGISFGGSTINSLAIAGLSLSWNTAGLYTGSNTKKLAQVNLDRISNQQETFLYNTNLQLKQAQNELEKHRTLLHQDDEIVLLKESIRKSYDLKFQNGMASMNDVLNATNSEAEARSNRALHEVQLLMSSYSLKTISGN